MVISSGFSRSFRYGERPAIVSKAQIQTTASVWYDANQSANFQPANPSNGNLISQWNDSSTGHTAHNAAPSGGNPAKPTYVTPSLNGMATLSFNGSNNLQVNAGNPPNWLASQSGFTMFVVAKLTSLAGTPYVTDSDQSGFSIYYNGTNYVARTAGGTGTSTVTGDTTNWHIFGMIFDGSAGGNDSRLRFRYDKVAQTLNFGATTVNNITNASTKTFIVGYDGSANNMTGNIAEIIMWTYTLDSGSVTSVEKYLSDKWAI